MREAGRDAGRRAARRFGRRAEWLALLWLMLKGYRPLARNYVVRGGEIDLVVRRGRTIAFVEVKARPALDLARTELSDRKARRIGVAARVWLARNPWAASGYTLRGDGLFVAPGHRPRHQPDAFALELMA